MGVRLENGQIVALYPRSGVRLFAQPVFYMANKECKDGISNNFWPSEIFTHLSKYCDDEGLMDAIKKLRSAMKILSKGL